MKRHMIAIMLCLAAGYASAQDDTLGPVTVEGINGTRAIIDCPPPNGAAACAGFHALIRQNFSPHEIGMLFGAATAYLEYPTSYDRTRARYIAFLRDIEENGVPPVAISYR